MLLIAKEAAWRGCKQHFRGMMLLVAKSDPDRIPIIIPAQCVVKSNLHVLLVARIDLDLVGRTDLHHARLVGRTDLHHSRLAPMRDLDPIWLVRGTDLYHARHVITIIPHPKHLVGRSDLYHSRVRDLDPMWLVHSRRTNLHHARRVATTDLDLDLLALAFTRTCLLDFVFLFLILMDDSVTVSVFLTEHYVLFVN